MHLNMDVITLAVEDPDRSKPFYVEGLGGSITQDEGGFVRLDLGEGSSGLALYRRDALATDADVTADGSGFRGVALSYVADSADEVDAVIAAATRAGGTIAKPAKRALWGGYSGYVADPDGHLWKVVSSSGPPRLRRGSPGAAAGPIPARPQETIVTVGVADIKRAKAFYEALGFPVDKSYGKFVSFNPEGSSGLGLYRRDDLARDVGVPAAGDGFRGFTFSCLTDSPDEVDAVIAAATAAGAVVGRPAEKAAWGGYSGYFTDPDGVLWKVAAN